MAYNFRTRYDGDGEPGSTRQQSADHADNSKTRTRKPEKKELVVASMAGDDTSWLDEFFADWKKNIYVVNNSSAPLTVLKNKGREAMPFLT